MTKKASLNKQSITRKIGQRTGLSNQVTEQVVDCLIEIMSDEIAAGGRIEFENFLTFEVETRTRTQTQEEDDEPLVG